VVDARVLAVARKYEEFANEYKGIFRIFFINCEKDEKLCQSFKVEKLPTIMIYPPMPIPINEFAIVKCNELFRIGRCSGN